MKAGITECAAASGAYVTVLDMNKTDGVTMVKALTDQGYQYLPSPAFISVDKC